MPLDDAMKSEIADLLKSSLPTLLGEAFKDEAFRNAIGATAQDAASKAVQKALKDAKLDEIRGQVETLAQRVEHEPDGDGRQRASKGEVDETNPAIKALKAEIEKLRRDSEAAKAEAERQQRAAREAMRDNKLYALLAEAGYPADAARRARAFLLAEGLLTFDEEGNPRMKGRDPNNYGAEGLVDLEIGIKQWRETDDGKAFLPARDVGGTGERKSVTATGGSAPRTSAGAVDWAAIERRIVPAI